MNSKMSKKLVETEFAYTECLTKPVILAVDDDRSQLIFLEAQLKKLGYDVVCAKNGYEALEIVHAQAASIAAILLDREMPGMNGLDVTLEIKKHPKWSRIPIIMQTGSGQSEQVKEGIDAGVFYYLIKPLKEELLKATVAAAIRESKQNSILKDEFQRHTSSFALMDRAHFTFSTLEEAEQLACFLAYLYPEPERVVQGITNLLHNAVEHGNLNIGYKEKSNLLLENRWREEVERRENLPENKSKKVEVSFKKSLKEFILTIEDEGAGFDYQSYLEVDPSRASSHNGRGIAIANAASFDSLEYNDKGNKVTAILHRENELTW